MLVTTTAGRSFLFSGVIVITTLGLCKPCMGAIGMPAVTR